MGEKRFSRKIIRGWFPQKPTCQNTIQTQTEKAGGLSKKAVVAYCAIYFCIVFPVLLLTDFLGLSLVYKTLAGAAAAGFAGAVAALLLKMPWRKKA